MKKSSTPIGEDGTDDWFPTDASVMQEAIAEVKSLFHNFDQLARVNHYKEDYEEKRAKAEQQLSSALRTQMEETKLGLQTLATSAERVSSIRNNFIDIDIYCTECQGLLSEWDDIKRVNNAKTNLEATTRLIENFRSIPRQAEALLDLLEDSPLHMKAVYLDLRKLIQLRDTAYSQGRSFSDSFKHQVQDSFEVLDKVAEQLETLVWEQMADCDILAPEDPAELLMAVELIVMEDKAKRKLFAKSDVKKKKTEAPPKTMREKMDECIKGLIANKFQALIKSEEDASAEAKAEAAEAKKKKKSPEQSRQNSQKGRSKGKERRRREVRSKVQRVASTTRWDKHAYHGFR